VSVTARSFTSNTSYYGGVIWVNYDSTDGPIYLYYTYTCFVNNVVAYTTDGGGLYRADSYTRSYSGFLIQRLVRQRRW